MASFLDGAGVDCGAGVSGGLILGRAGSGIEMGVNGAKRVLVDKQCRYGIHESFFPAELT